MPSWGPRKVKSNAHLYAAFRMIQEEVRETGDSVIEQLFVEIFNDHDSFVETLVDNLKKVEEVELEMVGGVKRAINDDDDVPEEPADVNKTVETLLEKFAEKDLIFTTKFFKVTHKNNQPFFAVAHPRFHKKAGELSYTINVKGLFLTTVCIIWILRNAWDG